MKRGAEGREMRVRCLRKFSLFPCRKKEYLVE